MQKLNASPAQTVNERQKTPKTEKRFAMRKPEECRTLVDAFTPDAVGGTRDNMGGAICNELSRVLMNCTMARHLEDPQYIHTKDITALCNAVEWFEAVFKELEE